MAISDKLNYLIETKQLFKDRLNSLGAEITSSTTFRNYLTWLDTFYGEVSDKTDLSINGVVGRTSQETTSISGGDEYDSPSPDYPQSINNLSGDVTYKITTQNGEQTFNIPLGDIELCKIDTYEDKIYSSDGRFYLNKNIDKIVLDGSESGWGTSGTNVSGKNRFANSILSSLILKPSSTSEVAKVLSDLFVPKSAVNTYGRINGISFNASGTMYIYYDAIETYSVNDFKTWLTTHNTEVQYVLATPTTTEITQENYPALYNALKQIQDYLTAYKINKEFILGYSSPEIEY